MKKIYKCCICHKILKEKPIRLVKQEYGIRRYNQYTNVKTYDFCTKCYTPINKFIDKYKEE